MTDTERAPTNEKKIVFGRLALLRRRAKYGYRRWLRKRYPERYRKEGDPPTE